MRSRNAAAMSTNLLPFSMYSGRLFQISSNFSGCSDARVATPTPATARPTGRRPVRKRIAPAANEPYISTFFQSIFAPSTSSQYLRSHIRATASSLCCPLALFVLNCWTTNYSAALQPRLVTRVLHGKQTVANVRFKRANETNKHFLGKEKVGVGIGATPTWGYCVCCYQNRRNPSEKVSRIGKININKHLQINSARSNHRVLATLKAENNRKKPLNFLRGRRQ